MNASELRANAHVAWTAFVLTLRMNAPDPSVLFTIVVQPLIVALLAMWMLVERGTSSAIYVVVGSGMTGLWSGLLFLGGNSITRERWTGTLELMVGQPTPISVIVFGKNLAIVSQSLSGMVVCYALAAVIFRQSLGIVQPLLFAGSLLLTVVAFVTFGLVIAPIFLLSPAVQNFQNALEFPVYLLCGFLFPIALLPGWTTPVSYLLSPYWAARALHGTSTGNADLAEVMLCWVLMPGLSVIYLGLSGRLMSLMLRRARADATLRME